MAPELRSLFSPIPVGRLTLKNRIYSSGHAEAMAEGGRPGARLTRYHEAKARGGCALTIFGGSSSVHPSSPAAAWKQIANHDDSIIPAYRAIADAVHAHGCLVFTQLTHLGRRAQADGEEANVLLAPSQIPERVHRDVPHELESEQIAELVRAFGEATRRCRDGGLDGVAISMAHNHLIDQFWSPLFNQRLDDYGGRLENRMRFGVEVLREIRRRVGRDFVVGVRISGDELTRGGLTAADMAEIARRLAVSGLIDFLSIIGGGAHTYELQAAAVPNMSYAPGVYVPLAAAIKQAAPGMPIFHASRIVDPVHADRTVAAGHIDVVGMTRALIADPDLPRKAREARLDAVGGAGGAPRCRPRGDGVASPHPAAAGLRRQARRDGSRRALRRGEGGSERGRRRRRPHAGGALDRRAAPRAGQARRGDLAALLRGPGHRDHLDRPALRAPLHPGRRPHSGHRTPRRRGLDGGRRQRLLRRRAAHRGRGHGRDGGRQPLDGRPLPRAEGQGVRALRGR